MCKCFGTIVGTYVQFICVCVGLVCIIVFVNQRQAIVPTAKHLSEPISNHHIVSQSAYPQKANICEAYKHIHIDTYFTHIIHHSLLLSTSKTIEATEPTRIEYMYISIIFGYTQVGQQRILYGPKVLDRTRLIMYVNTHLRWNILDTCVCILQQSDDH